MQCPQCGHSKLKIEVAFVGSVSCAFSTADEFELLDTAWFDSEWSDDSACACLNCSWTGMVRDAHADGSKVVATRTDSPKPDCPRVPMTEDELLEIKHELEKAQCPARWRQHFRKLVGELDRVNSLLETFVRLNDVPRLDSASDDDTVVG